MASTRNKILLVDDDRYLLGIYAEKFKEEGFDAITASDGQEAWELIQGGYIPEVVFAGILMPRMTGFDLIRKMQADPKLASIPVIISSHRGRVEDKNTAKELGVDDFIIQGITPLVEVVRRINLLIGINRSYVVHLERNEYDSEALINLLDKEQQTFIGLSTETKLFLKLEPLAEKGLFKVTLTAEEHK